MKWYEKNKNDDLEVVLISFDDNEKAMLKYLAGKKVNFPSLSFKDKALKAATQHADAYIPSFALIGEDGKAIIKSSDKGTLEKIEKALKAKKSSASSESE